MRIAYLLASAELSGGVRVVLDQARALVQRGHEVCVFIRQGSPDWYPYPVPWRAADDLAAAASAFSADVAIATFWTTLEAAARTPGALPVHLCQGIECDFREYVEQAGAIAEAYRLVPHKLVIGPWLRERLCARFGAQAFDIAVVGQCVDLRLYRPNLLQDIRALSARTPRILLPGLNTPVKGVADALAALHVLRRKGRRFRIVRVSPQAIDRAAEGLEDADEVYVHVTPREMARLYRGTSLVLTPSDEAEGFGLPYAEALGCRRPVVATAIASYLSLHPRQDHAYFVPVGDIEAIVQAIEHALDHRLAAWCRARRGAQRVRRQYAAAAVARNIEQALMAWLR